jgi:hypothetical protein
MACGYMQTGAMSCLLESGADPLVKDKQGRDVVSLVDNLRRSMPPSMGALQRIMALEQVAGGLTARCGGVVGVGGCWQEGARACDCGCLWQCWAQGSSVEQHLKLGRTCRAVALGWLRWMMGWRCLLMVEQHLQQHAGRWLVTC